MGVDPEHARELALALPAVSEAPHWHRLAFRTPRKICATLDATARIDVQRQLSIHSPELASDLIRSQFRRLGLPPWCEGVRSEYHAAFRKVTASMLARASAGVRYPRAECKRCRL
jgi:hypothetical protein